MGVGATAQSRTEQCVVIAIVFPEKILQFYVVALKAILNINGLFQDLPRIPFKTSTNWTYFKVGFVSACMAILHRPKSLAICGCGWKATKV